MSMRTLMIGVMLASLLGAATAQASTPPPGSVQVFFDEYMQENSIWIGGSVVIPIHVLAYDLPDNVEAVRFRLTIAGPNVVGEVAPSPGLVNLGSGNDYILEATDGCLPGRGLVELAAGSVTVLTYTDDASVCLEAVSSPGPTGSGLDFRRCGATDWEPMTPLYPGCAYVNPRNSSPAPIENNDPNAIAILAADAAGEPTESATVPIGVADILKRAVGSPIDLAYVDLDLAWDPLVATFGDVTNWAPTGWTIYPTSGPGWLNLSMYSDAGFDPGFGGRLLAGVEFDLAARETSTPLVVTINDLRDEAGLRVDGRAPDTLTLAVTCPKGDVLYNDDINALDALLTLNFAAGIGFPDAKQFCRADMNSNAEIEAGDAAAVLARAVGLPAKAGTAAAHLEATYDDGVLRFDVAAAAGFDVTARWDAAAGDLVEWTATPGFQGAERREPGELRLALARTDDTPAEVALRFAGEGVVVTVTTARTWNGDGTLLAELGAASYAPGGPLPHAAVLLAPRPNPFNPATTLRFTMPAAGPARLDVVDAQGRRVRSFVVPEAAAGPNELHWDGTDARGKPLPSGVYLLELRTGYGTSTSRATLLR
ncbi:MAG: hypothetical protein IPJ24_17045 [bacterium]|nr:hypothetical protein [bacterium]